MYHVIVGALTYQKYLKNDQNSDLPILFLSKISGLLPYIYEMLWAFFQSISFQATLFYKNERSQYFRFP